MLLSELWDRYENGDLLSHEEYGVLIDEIDLQDQSRLIVKIALSLLRRDLMVDFAGSISRVDIDAIKAGIPEWLTKTKSYGSYADKPFKIQKIRQGYSLAILDSDDRVIDNIYLGSSQAVMYRNVLGKIHPMELAALNV